MSNYDNISLLINNDDANVVLNLVGEESKILSSTVARLYYSHNGKWVLYETGLVLMVKDFTSKRYLIEFYDIDNGFKMFTEKVGKSFEYSVYDSNIHIIMSGSSCVLLSLADYTEGVKFSESMQKLIKSKNAKECVKNQFYLSHEEDKLDVLFREKPLTKVYENKRKFRKSNSDVGLPYNFRHLDHVGQHGFFLREIKREELKNYLSEISMEYLIDENDLEKPPPDGLLISDTNFYDIKSAKTNKFLKSKINKKDIGEPQNFIHTMHMGMNNWENLDLSQKSFTALQEKPDNIDKTKTLKLKSKMHISKTDISIPTNFRQIEHFGDKNQIYDED